MTNQKNLENVLSADPKFFLHWFLFFFCLEIACNKIVGGSGESEKKKKKKKKKNPENFLSPARKISKVGKKKKNNFFAGNCLKRVLK